jgi:ribose/xylose/arabinose/galactoside ABC-type transport system permease subunit
LAAAVIGGVSLTGGVGSLRGVLGGVLLLGAVQSALNIMTVSPYLVQLLRGVLVLVAIVVDAAKRRYR